MMRTTLDIPEDLHRVIASLATHTNISFSKAAATLMRRGLEQPKDACMNDSAVREDPETGLLVAKATRTITPEDVKALEDDV